MTDARDSELMKLFEATHGDNDVLTVGTTVDTGIDKSSNFNVSKVYDPCFNLECTSLIFRAMQLRAGLEWQAVDECRQKLDSSIRVFKERGKIFFNVSLCDFYKVS